MNIHSHEATPNDNLERGVFFSATSNVICARLLMSYIYINTIFFNLLIQRTTHPNSAMSWDCE